MTWRRTNWRRKHEREAEEPRLDDDLSAVAEVRSLAELTDELFGRVERDLYYDWYQRDFERWLRELYDLLESRVDIAADEAVLERFRWLVEKMLTLIGGTKTYRFIYEIRNAKRRLEGLLPVVAEVRIETARLRNEWVFSAVRLGLLRQMRIDAHHVLFGELAKWPRFSTELDDAIRRARRRPRPNCDFVDSYALSEAIWAKVAATVEQEPGAVPTTDLTQDVGPKLQPTAEAWAADDLLPTWIAVAAALQLGPPQNSMSDDRAWLQCARLLYARGCRREICWLWHQRWGEHWRGERCSPSELVAFVRAARQSEDWWLVAEMWERNVELPQVAEAELPPIVVAVTEFLDAALRARDWELTSLMLTEIAAWSDLGRLTEVGGVETRRVLRALAPQWVDDGGGAVRVVSGPGISLSEIAARLQSGRRDALYPLQIGGFEEGAQLIALQLAGKFFRDPGAFDRACVEAAEMLAGLPPVRRLIAVETMVHLGNEVFLERATDLLADALDSHVADLLAMDDEALWRQLVEKRVSPLFREFVRGAENLPSRLALRRESGEEAWGPLFDWLRADVERQHKRVDLRGEPGFLRGVRARVEPLRRDDLVPERLRRFLRVWVSQLAHHAVRLLSVDVLSRFHGIKREYFERLEKVIEPHARATKERPEGLEALRALQQARAMLFSLETMVREPGLLPPRALDLRRYLREKLELPSLPFARQRQPWRESEAEEWICAPAGAAEVWLREIFAELVSNLTRALAAVEPPQKRFLEITMAGRRRFGVEFVQVAIANARPKVAAPDPLSTGLGRQRVRDLMRRFQCPGGEFVGFVSFPEEPDSGLNPYRVVLNFPRWPQS